MAVLLLACARQPRVERPVEAGEPRDPVAAAAAESGLRVVSLSGFLANHFYPPPRPPRAAALLTVLPLGSVQAAGWLATRLAEVREAWAAAAPLPCTPAWRDLPAAKRGRRLHEALLLSGLLDGVPLDSPAMRCVEEVLATLEESAPSPPPVETLAALQLYHSVRADPRVVAAARRYAARVAEQVAAPEPEARDALLWLYDQGGDRGLLDLADRVAPGDDGDGERFVTRRAAAAAAEEFERRDLRSLLPGSDAAVDGGDADRHADRDRISGRSGDGGLTRIEELRAQLWAATAGDGLVALSYAPCIVRARVGADEGAFATVEVRTRYPQEERVVLDIDVDRAVSFPLSLRLPERCAALRVALNERSPVRHTASEFLTLMRRWRPADRLVVEFEPPGCAAAW